MKKTSFAVLSVLLISLILTGCMGSKKEETAGEFASASCNAYVKLMKCVVDKTPESARAQAQQGLDMAIAQWKQVDESQLDAICSQAVEGIAAAKDAYSQMGCELEEVATDADTAEVTTGTETAEVTTTGTETTTTGTELSGADAAAVNEVVNEVANTTGN